MGEPRATVVAAVQRQLTAIGCGPIEIDGVFGAQTSSAVRLFQTRYDLGVDGVVGSRTWLRLFRQTAPVVTEPPTSLAAQTLEIAASQRHVRERASNRGPEVDEYVRTIGLDPAGQHAWCVAYVHWCFAQAADALGVSNPCLKIPGVLRHWAKVDPRRRIASAAAFDDPFLVRPGAMFIIDHGHGLGHAGFVTAVTDGEIETLEGNTNRGGSREGDGVYAKRRTFESINVGFIDYAL